MWYIFAWSSKVLPLPWDLHAAVLSGTEWLDFDLVCVHVNMYKLYVSCLYRKEIYGYANRRWSVVCRPTDLWLKRAHVYQLLGYLLEFFPASEYSFGIQVLEAHVCIAGDNYMYTGSE